MTDTSFKMHVLMRLKLSSNLTVTPMTRLYLTYSVYLLKYCGFISEAWATRFWNPMYSSTFAFIPRNIASSGWPVKSQCPKPLTRSILLMAWSSPTADAIASWITSQSHEKAPEACNPWLRSVCSKITKNLWKYCMLLAFLISLTNSWARWLAMLNPSSVSRSIPLSLHLWNRTSVAMALPTSPISSIPCIAGQMKTVSLLLGLAVSGVSRDRSPCSRPCTSL